MPVKRKQTIAGTHMHVVYGGDYFNRIGINIDQGTLGYGQVLENVILEVLKSDDIEGEDLNPSSDTGSDTDFPFADIVTTNEAGNYPVLYSVKSTLQPLAGGYKTSKKKWVKGMEEAINLGINTQTQFVGPGLIWCQLDTSLTAAQLIPPVSRGRGALAYSPPIEIPGLYDISTKEPLKPMGPSGGFIPGIVFRFKKITPKSDGTFYKIKTLSAKPGDGNSDVEEYDVKSTSKSTFDTSGPGINSESSFKDSLGSSFSEKDYTVLISPAPTYNAYRLIRSGEFILDSDEYNTAKNKILSFVDTQIAAATRSNADTTQKKGMRLAGQQLFPDASEKKVTRFYPSALGITLDPNLQNKLDKNIPLRAQDYIDLGNALTRYYKGLSDLATQNLQAWQAENRDSSPAALANVNRLLEDIETATFLITEAGKTYTDNPAQRRQVRLATAALNRIEANVAIATDLDESYLDKFVDFLLKEEVKSNSNDLVMNDLVLSLIKLAESTGQLISALPEYDYNEEILSQLDDASNEITVVIPTLKSILGPQTFEQQLDQEPDLRMYDDIQAPADLQVTDVPQGEFDFQTPDSPALKFEGRKRMRHSLLDLLEEQMMAPMPALGGGSAPLDSRVIDDPFDLDLETQSLLGLTRADEVDIDEDSVDSDMDGVPNELDTDDDTPQIDTMIAERFMQDLLRNEKRVKSERSNFEVGESHATKLKKKYYGRY